MTRAEQETARPLPHREDLVDLRTVTTRWRIRLDAERLPVIPGRRGSVGAHDRTTLVVYLRGRRVVRRALEALPLGWRRHQIGDDEANLLAPLGDLDRAAELVRAYRRRRVSPDQRRRSAERMRAAVERLREASGASGRLPGGSAWLRAAKDSGAHGP
ncbi:MAG TPA: hypothetical protein VNJ53_13175 [Gaiellaceae bacterium]|nr:hypothetical protein [Gaiellaceae bacterium]